jgi:diguanylate cyclase (GGDEF)-like protein/PAS domain S-box-containing protein
MVLGLQSSVIVVVDDRVSNRNILTRLAQSLDVATRVHAFADPSDALRWMEANHTDLLITDYSMPGMNGATFIAQCRKHLPEPDLPIIVVTAYEDRSYRYGALEAGATDFLLSPIDPREFSTRARHLLTAHQHKRIIAGRSHMLERQLDKALRQKTESLAKTERKLRGIIDTVPALITATAPDGQCVILNSYGRHLVGMAHASFDGTAIAKYFGPDYWTRHRPLNDALFAGGAPPAPFEEELSDPRGERRIFLTRKDRLRETDTGADLVVTVSLDITERKTYEQRLMVQATIDSVTGLPNRTLVLDRLDQALSRATRNGTDVAILFIDLDEFKKVNDTVGHGLGDMLLRDAAERLRDSIRASDTVGRIGGDEFVVILPDVADETAPRTVCGKILNAFAAPFQVEGHEFFVGASLGVTRYPRDGKTADDLLRNADAAMYRAKALGRNIYHEFSPDLGEAARKRVDMECRLRRAAEREELSVAFQPICCVRSNAILGFEALMRWTNPDLGPVPPDLFIPLAEETGLIVAMGAWVLEEACRATVTWRDTLGLPLTVSVNVSYRQVAEPDFPAQVTSILCRTGLPPEALELEITERLLMHDTEHAHAVLSCLSATGVRLAIDDFGTGYASVAYLKHFPFDTLKIDKMFLADAAAGGRPAALVRAIVSMARALDLKVVGEGVETADQRALLAEIDCQAYQGYLESPPRPRDDIPAYVSARMADRMSSNPA